jgi:dGTPase
VTATTERASQVVQDLFQIYGDRPEEMQAHFAGQESGLRAVVDYIAGMTDRFALREHERLTGIKWQEAQS